VALGEVSLMRRDCLVLCSDGLTQGVTLTDIVQAMREAGIPQAACERLVQLANIAGGEDNITAIVVNVLDTGAWWN
jgi:serine/threonine protein phosphatase PrpC